MNKNDEEILQEISKRLYGNEWYIQSAIMSYKTQNEKTYTFFKDNDKKNIEKYNWCQRPCDTNMSLCKFDNNGEVCGWMSESLAETHGLEQITLNEFIHHFVKPIIKEKIKLEKMVEIMAENLMDEIHDRNWVIKYFESEVELENK